MSLRVSGLALKLPILSVLVTIALLVGFMAPTTAWASEGEEESTGFLAGLDTLVNPESPGEVVNDPVRDYEYEPVLRDGNGEQAVLPEEGEEIQSVISVVNKNPFQNQGSYGNTLLGGIRQLSSGTNGTLWIVPAIGIVFMWWGVRKVTRMILAAFRRGKASA